jgi:adenosylhomocysteine nucleosidase
MGLALDIRLLLAPKVNPAPMWSPLSPRTDGQGGMRMIVTVVGLAFEARIAARAGMRAVCGGDGRNLATSLNHAVMRGCSGLISFGVAGGLSPELRPGSCVVATSVHSAAAQYMTDPTWSGTLMRLIPNAVHGAIVGVSSPVAETDGKRTLYRDTGALAVDMESHIVASVASAHRLPMIAIRVVTDPAERALP